METQAVLPANGVNTRVTCCKRILTFVNLALPFALTEPRDLKELALIMPLSSM